MRSSRWLAFLALIVSLVPALAAAQTQPIREQALSSERSQQAALATLSHRIAALRGQTWACQDSLGTARTRPSASVWALPVSIPYRTWVANLWKARAASCGKTLSLRTLPAVNDWETATRLAERVYPGTQAWLLSCSSGEGGHGGWVPNHQGSGASGWMQFMRGTYYGYSSRAYADVRARGFIVSEQTNSWYHPLGQALTAAYMRHLGISHWHWDPRVDRLCA